MVEVFEDQDAIRYCSKQEVRVDIALWMVEDFYLLCYSNNNIWCYVMHYDEFCVAVSSNFYCIYATMRCNAFLNCVV